MNLHECTWTGCMTKYIFCTCVGVCSIPAQELSRIHLKTFPCNAYAIWSSTDSGASVAVRVRGECGGRAQAKAVSFDDAAAGLIMIFVELCSALPSSTNMKHGNNTKRFAITDTHSVQCIQESVERDQYSNLCTINDTQVDLTMSVPVLGFGL